MRRLTSILKVLGLFILAVTAVLTLLIVLMAVLVPDSVTDLRLGSEVLGTTVGGQAGTIVESAKINPLVDLLVLIGAYVFVCLISWSQDRLASYLRNRSHFS